MTIRHLVVYDEDSRQEMQDFVVMLQQTAKDFSIRNVGGMIHSLTGTFDYNPFNPFNPDLREEYYHFFRLGPEDKAVYDIAGCHYNCIKYFTVPTLSQLQYMQSRIRNTYT